LANLFLLAGICRGCSNLFGRSRRRHHRNAHEVSGWRPNYAPLGYLNDRATKTIEVDPLHFPIIRKMFELMLTGASSPRQVALSARDEWGFRTPRRRRIGGVPLAMSSVYKILSNPFYAGVIVWGGQTYPGKHTPVVTVGEFERVQSLLRRPSPSRRQRHSFPFTGMIRCGGCGYRITVQYTTNRYGTRYIYYHCVKRCLARRCGEPALEAAKLEAQIEAFLRSLAIEPTIEAWLLKMLENNRDQLRIEARAQAASLTQAIDGLDGQRRELTGLRLRNLLDDQEYLARRNELQREEAGLRRRLADIGDGSELIKPLSGAIMFCNQAADWFRSADDAGKKLIVGIAGSNPKMRAGKLSIEAAKPFATVAEIANSPSLLRCVVWYQVV
jgi:hypothetical protein